MAESQESCARGVAARDLRNRRDHEESRFVTTPRKQMPNLARNPNTREFVHEIKS